MGEFKREAVALLASSGRPLMQIATELGIAPSILRNWRNRSVGRNAGPALRLIPEPRVICDSREIRRECDLSHTVPAVLRPTCECQPSG
jgi:transposase-like protein